MTSVEKGMIIAFFHCLWNIALGLKLLDVLGPQLKASLPEHLNTYLWITFLVLVTLPI